MESLAPGRDDGDKVLEQIRRDDADDRAFKPVGPESQRDADREREQFGHVRSGDRLGRAQCQQRRAVADLEHLEPSGDGQEREHSARGVVARVVEQPDDLRPAGDHRGRNESAQCHERKPHFPKYALEVGSRDERGLDGVRARSRNQVRRGNPRGAGACPAVGWEDDGAPQPHEHRRRQRRHHRGHAVDAQVVKRDELPEDETVGLEGEERQKGTDEDPASEAHQLRRRRPVPVQPVVRPRQHDMTVAEGDDCRGHVPRDQRPH